MERKEKDEGEEDEGEERRDGEGEEREEETDESTLGDQADQSWGCDWLPECIAKRTQHGRKYDKRVRDVSITVYGQFGECSFPVSRLK